jgi:type 1 glutamine amidotransferase
MHTPSSTRKIIRHTLPWLVGACAWVPILPAAAPQQKGPPLQPITRDRSEVAAVLARAPRPTPADLARPLTIVLVADIKDHLADVRAHHYPLWQERWARLLGGSASWGRGPVNLYPENEAPAVDAPGAPGVRVLKAQQWPSREQFAAAHVVVAFCYIAWTPARLAELQQYLARGGGYVAIHSATWTKPKASAEVAAVVGVGGFQFFRHGVIKLRVDRPDHPICYGLPAEIELRDETYWPPTPDPTLPGFTVLASSPERITPKDETVKHQPIYWTAQPGAGRLFGCVPGHFTWTFDDPYFRLLLLRGIAWAAGASPYRFDSLVKVP